VDHVSVWSVDGEGRENMVCEYWTWTDSAHPSGIRFTGKFSSHVLGLALDFILMNQDQFTRPADASPEGLTLIDPPSAEELAEATTWMSGAQGAATNVSRADHERVATV
jgi:hypothetical protein